MRGFLLTALLVLAAIAIGVTVEPTTSTRPLPRPLAQAITRTLAARSVEIRTPFPGASTPAIYQAPDRWEGPVTSPTATGGAQAVATRPVIIGDHEYLILAGPKARSGLFPILHVPVEQLSEPLGLPPAQAAAFLPLIDARLGTGFRRVKGAWAFRLHVHEANVRVVGGTISLADGLVRTATIDESVGGHALDISSTYSRFNAAPAIPTPPQLAIKPSRGRPGPERA